MNEQEIEIINSSTRNDRIKSFIKKNIKLISTTIITLLIFIILYIFFNNQKQNNRINLSNKYNELTLYPIGINENQKIGDLKDIVLKKDKTYSLLAFYYLIDNDLITDTNEINKYFDLIINDLNLSKDIKYLNIYKKALYNSQYISPEQLNEILKPIIEDQNIWRSHALFLLGEFYISIGKKKEAKRYYEKIIADNKSNKNIKLEAQKRIQRDLSD